LAGRAGTDHEQVIGGVCHGCGLYRIRKIGGL
jgi:hypothetical protein